MQFFHHLRVWLVAVGLLHLALPARAADPLKCLPDDTDLLVRVEVQQIVTSPLYKKEFQKQADDLLKMDAVAGFLKGTGLDPLKDIDEVYIVMGRSSFRTEIKVQQNPAGGIDNAAVPFIVVQGRFDPAKLQAKAEQLAKDMPQLVKKQKFGAVTIWEIGKGTFVAVADKNTIVVGGAKEQVEAALDRAAGKKQSNLKHKSMKALLEKLDPKKTVQWLACEEAVGSVSAKGVFQNGQTIVEIKYTSLKDMGIQSVVGSATVATDVKITTTIKATNADKAKEAAKGIEDGLGLALKAAEKMVDLDKSFASVVDALKAVKVVAKGDSIQIDGQANGDVLSALIRGWMMPAGKP